MFGRVIFAVILGVAAALLGSFSLLDRLAAPAPVVAAPAPGAEAPAGLAAEGGPSEPSQRESSGYREALLEADQRGQYAGEALDQRIARAYACRHGRKRRLRLRFDRPSARP